MVGFPWGVAGFCGKLVKTLPKSREKLVLRRSAIQFQAGSGCALKCEFG